MKHFDKSMDRNQNICAAQNKLGSYVPQPEYFHNVERQLFIVVLAPITESLRRTTVMQGCRGVEGNLGHCVPLLREIGLACDSRRAPANHLWQRCIHRALPLGVGTS